MKERGRRCEAEGSSSLVCGQEHVAAAAEDAATLIGGGRVVT